MRHKLPITLTAAAIATSICVSAAAATTQARSLVLYAKVTRAQFMNHADDRARGNASNPFNVDVALPTPPGANTRKKGARAGDQALVTLKLYSDAHLTRPVGSVVYSCTFNFTNEALCEANFELKNATMIAMGPADLSAAFILPVIGGTGRYAGAHGEFTSTPTTTNKNVQAIHFLLL
jgi:hypothetical protein